MELHNGDCLEIMEQIPDSSVDMVLTDPPYYKVKNEPWDRQWNKPEKFLEWLEQCVVQWHRILKPNGSLYCFASPQMNSRVDILLRKYLCVLNNIRWVKQAGWHNKTRKEDLRQFLNPWESVIFAEHYGADNIAKGEAGYQVECDKLRGFVFEPLRAYLDGERDKAGWSVRKVAEAFQQKTGSRTITGMAGHWFSSVQWVLPTKENYLWLRALFSNQYLRREYEDLRREYEDLRREYKDLRREYEDLRREYEDLRRPFNVTAKVPCTDVWTFEPVRPYKGKHPCEKPQDMLWHIINASTREEAVVLDCFMGTGSTGMACYDLNRQFIGIELNKSYFQIAKERIKERQESFFAPAMA